MRIFYLFLVLAFASCKSYEPNTQKDISGVYVGQDSLMSEFNKYGQKMIGKCITVEKNENNQYVVFSNINLVPIDENNFSFDVTYAVDYGIGNDSDIHQIRKVAYFKFSGNKLVVEYSVGELGGTMSNFLFEGWR